MNLKIKNWQKFILLVQCGLVSCLIFTTAYNSFNHSDDFWIRYLVNQKGYFKTAEYLWFNWDGRALAPTYIFRDLILVNFDPRLASFLSLSCLFALGYLLRQILIPKESTLHINTFIIVTLIAISLWLGFRPHISRSIYWSTGSFYIYSNLTLWATIYFTLYSKDYKILTYFALATTMLSGVNSALSFLVLFCLLSYHQNSLNRTFLLQLLFSLIFLTINIIAPGNAVRGKGLFSFVPGDIINGFILVTKEYSGMSLGIVIGAVVIALYLSKFELNFKDHLKLSFIYLVAGGSTILPFIFFPSAASKHTSIFFQTYLLVSLVLLFTNFLIKINRGIVELVTKISIVVYVPIVGIIAVQQIDTGIKIQSQLANRYDILEGRRGTRDTIFLKPIQIPQNAFTHRFFELTNDPNNDHNILFSNYFNVGPVVLKDEKCYSRE